MSIQLVRSVIRDMKEYKVSRPTDDSQWQLQDFNENLFLPNEWTQYPQKQPPSLVKELCKLYQVQQNELLIGRGSDELIDCIVRCFCEPHTDKIVQFPPTFSSYEISSKIAGVGVLNIPLNKNGQIPLDETLSKINSEHKVIFICSPNNPTGNLIDESCILKLVNELNDQSIVVVDEAYIEFSDRPSLTSLATKKSNLIVLRTLSKIFGLASARVGALITHPSLLKQISKTLPPFPIPTPVSNNVLRNLKTINPEIKNLIIEEKNQLIRLLKDSHSVEKIYPSDANFILVKVHQISSIMKNLENKKIKVREKKSLGSFGDCLRITIGTPKQNKKLLEAFLT